jgi:O-antigen ligase
MIANRDSRSAAAFGARARLLALVAFFVVVALTGGGARADILSLVVLRPFSVLFAAYAIMAAPRGSLAQVGGPLALVAFLAVIVAVQLIPLPPGLWHALPAREAVVRIDALVGMESAWRPLTLSPAGTWNALFSLVIPVAAILLYGALEPGDRFVVIKLWLGFAVASALLAIAQLLGDSDGPLYFYAVTSTGEPVGLLSNANHQAVLLVSAIPLAAFWGSRRDRRNKAKLVPGALMAALFLFVVVLTASRAGLALAVPATAISFAVLLRATRAALAERRPTAPGRRPLPRSVVLGGAVAATIAVAGAGVMGLASRASGLAAVVTASAQDEMRFKALPTLLEMLGKVWVLGTGAGSFDKVYKMFEPVGALSRYYLNHAHNDWLEVLLDHGLLGLAALIVVIAWAVRSAARLWQVRSLTTLDRVALAFPLAAVAVSSLVDYPLRVPVVVTLFVLLILAMRDGTVIAAAPRAAGRSSGGRPA